MVYELVERIGDSDVCLTFIPEERTIYVKHYVESNENECGAIYTKKPLSPKKVFDELTPSSADFRYIQNQLKNSKNSTMKIIASSSEFRAWLESSLISLQDKYIAWCDGAEERAEQERLEREEEEQEALEEIVSDGESALEESKHPLLWIANTVDWLTAGERMNIMYAWIAYCSQIILNNPISVIGIGEANSGKSHILEAALDMLPEQYVLRMKSATMAATYAMADDDPYFFDGKIVYIGDMGGSSDHEDSADFKDLMKELQTDGIARRVKMVDGPEGPVPKWYELNGYPCLTYTTVPGHSFEDQEMSRSVMLSPRQDNDEAVSVFKYLNEMTRGPSYENIKSYKERIPIIQNMVIALRHRMQNLAIVNPYRDFIRDYLKDTKYFKRDFSKYNGILKVITAINGHNRETIDGVLFTTVEDIMIFIELLSRYHESITLNLSPNATDVLRELRDKAEEWDLYEDGISISDYMYSSVYGDSLSKKSIANYFSQMNSAGILKYIKEGREGTYQLVKVITELNESDIKMPEHDQKMLEYNFGISCEKLRELSGDPLPGQLSDEVDPPYWNKFLKK